NLGLFTPLDYRDTVHVPTSNGGVLFGGMASEPTSGAVYVIAHDNPGILRLLRPGENAGRGGAPPVSPGQALYAEHCQKCHGADRLGTGDGVPLIYGTADPTRNIAAGAPSVDAARIREMLAVGQDRMPAFPHFSEADVANLISYLTAAPGGRGRVAGPGALGAGGRGGGAPAGSGAPPELIVGSGSAWTRPADAGGGRGRGAAPYPDGVPQY